VTSRNGKSRVLVVDDEASVLTTYKLILEQKGYSVTAAASCKEALIAVRSVDFDLVLCDFSLEQQHTGFEVIEAARRRNREVPSVILTGYATMETSEQAKLKGIQILFKPIDIEEFLGTTETLLRFEDEHTKKED
jgi:CheY-like chemotaxis protein